MEWKPIETLPKETYRFDIWAKSWLVMLDKFQYRRFTDCDFCPNGYIRVWGDNGATHLYQLGWYATHWTPVPEKPTNNID